MDQPFLRLLIQEKLADGRLPRAPIPRMWGGPGHGETCDGCGEIVTSAQTVMENLDDAADGGVQLHVACFHVWDVERQAYGTRAERPSSGPIRVRSPRRPSGPAMGTERAASPAGQPRHRDARVGERGEGGTRGAGTRGAGPAAGLPWTLRRRPSCQKPAIGCARPAATAPSSDWVPSRPPPRGFGAPTAAPRAPRSSSSSSRCGG